VGGVARQEGRGVITYRTFRNGDPPAIRELWNLHAAQSRGCGWLASCDNLELLLFSKPYFEQAAIQLAFDNDRLVGLCVSGFGTDDRQSALDTTSGTICLLLVHEAFRRQGIGRELVRLGQKYLCDRGAANLYAGALHPVNPFGTGLFGGSETPGVLESDAGLLRFFEKLGYEMADTCFVFQLPLTDEIGRVEDPRLPLLRRKVRIFSEPMPNPQTWWNACITGPVMTYRYEMLESDRDEAIGNAIVWEMETFTWAWKVRAFGVTDFYIEPTYRRQGYAKLLLQSVLKHLQENKIGLVEVQTMERNAPAIGLYQGLGFAKADTGHLLKLPN
jgi:ribosomal protein S18 acetylase RimI-like enzyme